MGMYAFLKSSPEKYCFYDDSFQITSRETVKLPGGGSYQRPVYSKVATATKYQANNLYIRVDDGKGSQCDLSCIKLIIKDDSDTDCGYIGGTGISYEFILPIVTYSSERPKVLAKLIRFVGKIPEKSRKKLIKALYLHDKYEEKGFHAYERLYSRLASRFGLCFVHRWTFSEEKKFGRIGPTYTIDANRNRKINKLLRNRKCI